MKQWIGLSKANRKTLIAIVLATGPALSHGTPSLTICAVSPEGIAKLLGD